jgi:hypothetical protein
MAPHGVNTRLAQSVVAAGLFLVLPWIACVREPDVTKMKCTTAKGCPPSYVCTDTGSGWYCKSPRDGGPAADVPGFASFDAAADAQHADDAASVDGHDENVGSGGTAGSDGDAGDEFGSGGAQGTGGSKPTDASIGSETNDAPIAGGGVPSSGGNTALGGATGSGGVVATGGSHTSGGAAGSGGAIGTGGVTRTGGIIGVGGSVAATGGSNATGGVVGPDAGPDLGPDLPMATGGAGTGGVLSTGGTQGTGGTTSPPDARPINGSNGCGNAAGAGGYTTIQSGGQSRGFIIRLPDNYDSNHPYWLIFGFHGNGGTAADVDSGGSTGAIGAHFGLQKLSNSGAIFVAPDGLSGGWANSGGRDLAFVDDMVKSIEDTYCVDTTRLFANGFSYGGGMTYEIACARANVFRGVAIYEGAQLSGCDGGNDPIALWQMAGITDGTTSIGIATPMRDKFGTNNGCTKPAQEPARPTGPPPYLNPGGHVCTDYAGCSTGHPLRWCVHQSGHGASPVDGTSDLYNSCAIPPSSCSDLCPCSWVPADVWQFFTSL